MFDIGFLELLLIGVVGLLVLGPERLPRAARTAGMWIGRLKRSVSGIQREINEQLKTEELRQTLNDQQKSLDEGIKRVNREVEGIADNGRKMVDGLDPSAADSAPPGPEQRLDQALAKARQPAPEAGSEDAAEARPDATPAAPGADKDTRSQ